MSRVGFDMRQSLGKEYTWHIMLEVLEMNHVRGIDIIGVKH